MTSKITNTHSTLTPPSVPPLCPLPTQRGGKSNRNPTLCSPPPKIRIGNKANKRQTTDSCSCRHVRAVDALFVCRQRS